ncbi:MAG: HAD family phosphatase [Parvibaculum sp.]|uniref:HAD family hydrolase n=1 Tax=Parvibaculum sp. TaxID=2024848 RepID=UPI002ABC6401|nr:HAD family phosphatase [Parvibaculum sp.]MDZ4379942.1 HAD family phosphatase [Parvibaculum sp.]
MAFSFSPSLVIFDCDGVLVDTEPVGGRVFAEGVVDLGYPASFDECLRTFRGRSMTSAVEIIEARMGRAVPVGWADEMWRRTELAFAEGVAPIAGVAEVISHIHERGIPFCLASSGEMPFIHRNLKSAGLFDFFAGRMFNAAMVARGKPAPDLFLHAAAHMRHTPECCLVIEDSVPGVQAGVAAGMTVIGYAGDPMTDADALKSEGAHVVSDMSALIGLLEL